MRSRFQGNKVAFGGVNEVFGDTKRTDILSGAQEVEVVVLYRGDRRSGEIVFDTILDIRLSTNVLAWISGIIWVTRVGYNWSMVSKATVNQVKLMVVT